MTAVEHAHAPADAQTDDAADAEQLEAAIFTAMADPAQPRLVFQPIVDLRRGDVVGYEMLSRFVSPLSASPERWFAEAYRLGVGARLQADIIRRGIDRLSTLPDGTFLAVNLDPKMVTTPEIAELFTTSARLDRLVIELTRQAVASDVRTMLRLLDRVREAGAIVAMDDTGAGYGSLQILLTIRPELVKVDRSLVAGLDRDVVRRSLIVMLGEFVGRMGGRIVAEGLEEPAELEACVDLGVALGQGWLLGRPAEEWQLTPPVEGGETIRGRSLTRDTVGTLAPLMTTVPAVASDDEALQTFATQLDIEHVVVVDDHMRPAALIGRVTTGRGTTARSRLLLARTSEHVTHVAHRAAARDSETRFDPVVCLDERGRFAGIVPVDRLLDALATRHPGAANGGAPPAVDGAAPPGSNVAARDHNM